MVALDVQKTFDCVNHEILCKKLELMGVDHHWFKSYLSSRSQIVSINSICSTSRTIQCGVPQGSLLGPLLYLCYCNDMSISVESKLLLYADDSIIMYSDKDPNIISQKLASELESCNTWLIENKLSLHMGKCESILFGSKRKCKKIADFTIECNGQSIKSQQNVKYLGFLH